MSTGVCPFRRPRSSSLDPFIESSFSIEPNISSPSKTYINRNEDLDQFEKASYLVIGGGKVRKEEDYANYQLEDNRVKSKTITTGAEKRCFFSPSRNSKRSDKPETSSNSTIFTVTTSISSSSGLSSLPPLSPISRDCDMKSPSSLHDSNISRLIDAVSLGNEQDTCGSISTLIGQFESSVDQSKSHNSSHVHIPFHHLNYRPNTPITLRDLRPPLKTITASTNKNYPKVAEKTNHEIQSPCKTSQAGAPAPALLSSPETAELEEVYTILDEEVLSPVSVYNLRKQTVHVQTDTRESTPFNSLRSSPAKVVQGLGKGPNLGWDEVNKKKGGSEESEETEESVYEEVYDPPALASVPGREKSTSNRNTSSSVNNNCFQFLHDSAGNAFTEVELNVDEDPLEMMITSPKHGNQWEGPMNPTKRQAIYQNHESTPNHSQQKQPFSYRDPPQLYPPHVFSQRPTPMNQSFHQLANHHQHQNNSQAFSLHRPAISRSSNPSPLRQNSYPVPQSNSDAFNKSKDFKSSYTQQRSYSGNGIINMSQQDRLGYNQMEMEQGRSFYNSISSSEKSHPGQSSVSTDCDAVYSHLDFDCITPSSESSAPRKTQPHSQSQTQSYTPTHSWNQHVSLNTTRHQTHPESRDSLRSNVGPTITHTQFGTIDPTAPSPCKSKSLGDLTSEDISCNFQSKYHIISRSFITPHTRKQNRIGTMGEVTVQSQSCDPLTEQLRKLVSLEGDDSDRPQPPQLRQEAKPPLLQPQVTSVASVDSRGVDDSPPLLTRRLSSRSQSRVRHINSRAREKLQEALKPRAVVVNSSASLGGVVLRNKPASQNPPANRHSTGSYIAGYLGQLEDRGLPEGACTSLRYGNGDHFGDPFYTDDSLPPVNSNHYGSEPEVYFLLRL